MVFTTTAERSISTYSDILALALSAAYPPT